LYVLGKLFDKLKNNKKALYYTEKANQVKSNEAVNLYLG
jgi:hypothetical protein